MTALWFGITPRLLPKIELYVIQFNSNYTKSGTKIRLAMYAYNSILQIECSEYIIAFFILNSKVCVIFPISTFIRHAFIQLSLIHNNACFQ